MRIGLVVNPIAGMGGSVGLSGTDGEHRVRKAREMGAEPQAAKRCAEFLLGIKDHVDSRGIELFCVAGEQGGDVAADIGLTCHILHLESHTLPNDTQAAVDTLLKEQLDVLVFVGGDGTARDVLAQIPEHVCTLGVPAGVKMHSGVFAVTPQAAAKVVDALVKGGLVALHRQEVRDFELATGEKDELQVITFGELLVPDQGGYMQHTKVGGVESEPLVAQEIAAYVADVLAPDHTLIIGPGSTCMAIKSRLGVEGTLRGFEVVAPQGVTINAAVDDLLNCIQSSAVIHVILSFTRQQGFLLGRGNQQLSAACVRHLQWPQQVSVVSSRNKLGSLEGRPLLVDTSDRELDELLTGIIPILAGYDDILAYRVARDYADQT